MKNDIIRYKIPSDFNVEVKTLFKGNLAESDLFEKKPELYDIYPTRVEVVRKYKEIKKIADAEKRQFTIIVSENGIEVKDNSNLTNN